MGCDCNGALCAYLAVLHPRPRLLHCARRLFGLHVADTVGDDWEPAHRCDCAILRAYQMPNFNESTIVLPKLKIRSCKLKLGSIAMPLFQTTNLRGGFLKTSTCNSKQLNKKKQNGQNFLFSLVTCSGSFEMPLFKITTYNPRGPCDASFVAFIHRPVNLQPICPLAMISLKQNCAFPRPRSSSLALKSAKKWYMIW